MAANNAPIFSATPRIDGAAAYSAGAVIGPTANTAQDGSGSAMYQVTQAGANGSYLQKVRFRAVGSPAATVARLFACSAPSGSFTGGTTNTATNTWLLDEISLPAVTLSQTTQSPTLEINLNYGLPPGYRLLVAFGTSTGAAGTGYSATVIGGDY